MRLLPLLALVVLLSLHAPAAEPLLPEGKATPPVPVDHFPSRLHALVWRNWNLVSAERMAAVVGARADDVRALAASMGLAAERPIPAHYKSRLYLTVLRRNWHLLPYPQLLKLVDMMPEQLAYVLREDDFFWAKLGYVKPKCEPIAWAEPDAAAKARAAEIRELALKHFGPGVAGPAGPGEEEPLAFLNEFAGDLADDQITPRKLDLNHPRFLYSYFAVFGDPLSDPTLDPYPDKLLARLADVGVNGVWLHVVLRDLAPSQEFPEFGRGWEQRLASLRKLVDRAKRFGIAVYLYQNEPRAMPEAFYKVAGRAELAGVLEGEFRAMCTSRLEVRQWLTESLAHVFSNVPDLGGAFTITASENLTSCASHHKPAGCPRCAKRKPAEIIAEVNTAIAAGVRKGSPTARTIVWDWGWKDEYAADVIAGLPEGVFFESVSEWSLPLNRGGVPVAVGEYSISAVGPGPRATKHWALAKARGLKTVAKVQVNNTWELSAVPYLPTMDLVVRHAQNLSKQGVDGLQLSWSLGGHPSPNLKVFQSVLGGTTPDAAIDAAARELFGDAGAPAARRAWRAYSAAFEQFPYGPGVLYLAPQQTGPANLLFEKPTGYTATMVCFPYDDLKRWRGPYLEDVFIAQFEKVADGFRDAETALADAVAKTGPDRAAAAKREFDIARAARVHFASVAHQARFVRAREMLAKAPPDQRQAILFEMRTALDLEAALAKELYGLQRRDSRIGFEASNHYFYLGQDLVEKVINCHWIVGRLK